jgi:hypothetical protein
VEEKKPFSYSTHIVHPDRHYYGSGWDQPGQSFSDDYGIGYDEEGNSQKSLAGEEYNEFTYGNDEHDFKDYYHYPQYKYEYGVNDPHTGDHKSAWEHRDGDVVKGEQRFLVVSLA